MSPFSLAGRRARYAGRNASTITDMDKLHTILRQAVMMVRLEREGVNAKTVNELSKISVALPFTRSATTGPRFLAASYSGSVTGAEIVSRISAPGTASSSRSDSPCGAPIRRARG